MFRNSNISCLFLAAGLLGSNAAFAEDSSILLGKLSGENDWDRTWSVFTLYKSKDNPVLQEFALQGRIQPQFAAGESSTEDYHQAGKGEFWGSDVEVRRTYLVSALHGFMTGSWRRNVMFIRTLRMKMMSRVFTKISIPRL